MHDTQSARAARLLIPLEIVLAVCSTVALALLLPTTAPLHERANSAIWIVCAAGLFFLIRYGWGAAETMRGRLYFLSFGLLLSFVYALGRYIYLYHKTENLPIVALCAVLLAPAAGALLATALRLLERAAHPPACGTGAARRSFLDRKHLFVPVFAAMLLCYIPCYLAFFPANIQYDITSQTQQAVTGVFSANHPLLHTLFIKVCLDLGVMLWGGYTGGFALYAAVQTVLLVACFAYAVCCIVRITPGQTVLHWLALLLFALYPSNHLFAVTTTKDVLASGAMLVSLCALCMLLCAPEPFRQSWKRYALFAVSSILAMLLRNGAVYAYLALAACLLAFIKRFRLRLLIPTALSVCAFFGASGALKNALHAGDSSPVELLAVPIQQLVNASIENPECFTSEEQALFDALIETNQRYQPQIVDPIKEFIDPDVLMQNKQAYWRLYCSIGKKAPAAYVDAFLTLNLAIWYPDEITHANVHGNNQGYLHASDWFYNWDRAPVTVEKHSYLPAMERLYEKFSMDNLHQKIPVFSMLFSPGFLCQVMFALAILLLYRRQFLPLLVFAPLLAYWVGLLFAPCIYIRYVYPIIVCLPLLIALTVHAFQREDRSMPLLRRGAAARRSSAVKSL